MLMAVGYRADRSIDRNVVKKFGVETKILSPHKVRHSTITAALDRTNGGLSSIGTKNRVKDSELLETRS
jgi:hypothetical protein